MVPRLKILHRVINYITKLRQYKKIMAEWKLKRSFMRDHARVKSEIKEHCRQRSEEMEKTSPWDLIGQALTQRYNRKFLQIQKEKELEHNGTFGLDGFEQKNTPKFIIKRKYLSFDYKGREHLEVRSSIKMSYGVGNKGQTSISSSLEYYSLANQNKKSIRPRNKSVKTEQTVAGTYFVPLPGNSNSNKGNYKCIYIKKNRKKIGINPELQISLKKAEEKLIDPAEEIGSARSRKMANLHNFNFYPYLEKKRPKIVRQLTEGNQDEDMFRPWSGQESDEN